ncbi:hypothetical protein OIO90_002527 [Microbotryomycetes sp. JL221]|nr:hypothetical protein OIO90_002527 [Microbotryomycetes sp. JL221]
MKYSVLSLLALATTVLAGLEDAQHSIPLTPANFQSTINSAEKGTLVAFFAPWCGHCKSMATAYDAVAKAFEGDDRCKVAHLNADDPEGRPLAQDYEVRGYPTIKFIRPGGQQPIDYSGARTEAAFLEFLNDKCGTNRVPGGGLNEFAGRIKSLDAIASDFMSPTATRPALLESASAVASSLSDEASSLASYYVKVMTKFTQSSVEEIQTWINKETTRLNKLMSNGKKSISGRQLDELKMKQNILSAFTYVEQVAEQVVDKAEQVIDRVKEEL